MHVYPRDRLHCDYLLDRTASRSNQNHGSARVRLGCDGYYNLFSCTSCLRHVSKLSSKRLLDMFQLDNGDFVLLFCFILWQGVCNDTYMWTQVSGFTFILMHATGVCTPTSVVQQIMILHCAMLFMRLLFDLNKNCGIMLEWTVLKCKTKIFYGVSNELIAARHTKACRPDAATFLVWQEWSPTQRGKKLSRWMPSVHSRDDVSTKQFWQHTNVRHMLALLPLVFCVGDRLKMDVICE